MRLPLLEHPETLTTTLTFMTEQTDTICAISTPPGIGGIAIARISGPKAIEITQKLWKGKSLDKATSHTAHFGTILTTDGCELDQALVTLFKAPHSFTGDDVVEISVHGSKFVQRELLNQLIKAGCRMALPGEYTRRAFISGKMDLAEAEAVADVIASNSRAAHRIAISQMRGDYSKKLTLLREKIIELASLLELELDFSEEDVEFASRQKLREIASEIHSEVTRLYKSFSSGTAIKDGIPVAIVGHTNAGKSSLLNAILSDDRAIVSDIHGTTRDTIEETIELGDYLFRFIDTAGLRQTADEIELQGINRSYNAISKARIIILVVDPTSTETPPIASIQKAMEQSGDTTPAHLITAINKADICNKAATEADGDNTVVISAKTGHGLEQLKEKLIEIANLENGNADEGLLVTNARHAEALRQAQNTTSRILDSLDQGLTGDLIALDLRETIHHLSSITGDITTTAILSTIFSRFCIGK
ncbi:MAG: tRNA uridine-5-carboxymethylaminomethyl(34) synthesis GTPase MnmE [Firmicutes bacterium]|nr:tRNA uridine-5-carboxymethylaminomethyl(34) synthesis GTPase MnmE [Bacillota bacterium]MCM1401609.1 tRNA uridine-5-carboxymethylaminomethyl(34) synthesis GTPase MnmE [Bacteroides sp.]MCM1477772.1 tRNA uridine-5-carboxymethylaminomethyl(34) synthesis GTPase MnmE [Bacteroides sp.]